MRRQKRSRRKDERDIHDVYTLQEPLMRSDERDLHDAQTVQEPWSKKNERKQLDAGHKSNVSAYTG